MNHLFPSNHEASSGDPNIQPDEIEGVIRINAAAIADAHSGVITPGSLIVKRSADGVEVLASGTQVQMDHVALPKDARIFDAQDQILLPGLVNAHTHLDLTHIGVRPHEPEDGFVSWVDMIRANRRDSEPEITHAVDLGIEKLLQGGTSAVGDIAGAPGGEISLAPLRALGRSCLAGVSFLEFFGIGSTRQRTRTRLESFFDREYDTIARSLEGTHVRIGLQPHAPNTVDRSLYQFVAQRSVTHGIPLSTHLAETREERAFIMDAAGSQRALLERLGVWDDSILETIGSGQHPIEHLLGPLKTAIFLAAHVNDAPDQAIEWLAQTNTNVVYCPRASAYFGADLHFGPHRYREMLDAGVRVCLGTDSIVNLDTPDRISTLDEMRVLHRRDATGAETLIAMSTINGAASLLIDQEGFTLGSGARPRGIIAIGVEAGSEDPWASAMESDALPTWVFAPR